MKTVVVFVGPEEEKWKSFTDPKVDVQAQVYRLLKENAKVDRSFDHGSCIETYDYSDLIFCSGRCPKGGVDVWSEEIADQLGIEKRIFPAEVNQWNDYIMYKHDEIGCRVKFTYKGYKSRNIQIATAGKEGEKYVLYCIVPYVPFKDQRWVRDVIENRKGKCIHCEVWGHPTNGGCWTRKYANKIGKETHLVVIDDD